MTALPFKSLPKEVQEHLLYLQLKQTDCININVFLKNAGSGVTWSGTQ